MRVINCGQDESIIIDADTRIAFLDNRHGQGKLGIEAPDDVGIWREEIYQSPSQRINYVEIIVAIAHTIYGLGRPTRWILR